MKPSAGLYCIFPTHRLMVFITASSSKIPSNSDSTTRSGALRVWETFRFAVMIYVYVSCRVDNDTKRGGCEGVSCMLGSGTGRSVEGVCMCVGQGADQASPHRDVIIVMAAGKESTKGGWTHHALRPSPLHAGHTHRQRRGDDLRRCVCVCVCGGEVGWGGVRPRHA